MGHKLSVSSLVGGLLREGLLAAEGGGWGRGQQRRHGERHPPPHSRLQLFTVHNLTHDFLPVLSLPVLLLHGH